MNSSFVHLRLHSAYSLAEGAIKVKKLVKICEEHRMPAVAITDTNNLFGALEFSTECADHGIQPIIACQLNIQHPKKNNQPTNMLFYAQNEEGYLNLIQMVSAAWLESNSEMYPEVSLNLLEKFSKGLIITTGGASGSLAALLAENDTDAAKEYLIFLKKYFEDRLYIELSRHNFEIEQKTEEKAVNLAYDLNIPLVATNNVCYANPEDFNAHDVLICISQGCTIYDNDRIKSSPEFYFKSSDEMLKLFEDIPEATENTVNIAKRCGFMLHKIRSIMPQYQTQDGRTQDEELEFKASTGLLEKLEKFKNLENYDEIHKIYWDRMEYELSVIKQMGFSGYFLIVADYVQWAKDHDIPVGPGRGSGAGSIVAWSIHITDVDPMRFKLFFERFLNPDRVSMPDFDVDFCQERREEVIGYVQEKYGKNSVAQIITFGTLQAKAVVKDVGRVLGMAYGFVDKISKLIPFNPANPIPLQEAIDGDPQLQSMMDEDLQVKELMGIALRLEGLYRHSSVHAAGVVISDKDLRKLAPLYKDPKSTMPVTQFSMKFVESAGLIKFDFLGLKTLTVIQKALNNIKKRGINLKAQDIPLDDKKTFELLQAVNCVGVFQIESAGMRDVVKKMKPDKIEDLVALVALYRPGPMDDIPKYIACKHGLEPITYLHEKLKPILEETYGVMVYQEQVMQIAQEIGGYTLGQADLLRRAMGKKKKEEMLAQKKRFIDGAVANNVDEEIAERLFEQMNKFAGYGFNKSHSTPYGLLTYQTAYLKANYPIEFMAAIMTLDMANTDKLAVYYQDCKKNKIKVEPPDINFSDYDFFVNYENNSIRYSLGAIKGSGEQAVKEIVRERNEHGPYTSIFDFYERVGPLKVINRRTVEFYIKAGVFDNLHPNRHQLFESLDLIMTYGDEVEAAHGSLFEKTYPPLANVLEWSETEKLQHEFDAIGFYISAHPMEQYEDLIQRLRFSHLSDVKHQEKSKVAVIINGVTRKTTKKQTKFYILMISDSTGFSEAMVFSRTLENYGDLINVGNIVVMDISCQQNDDQARIQVDKIQKFDENYSPGFIFGQSGANSSNFAEQRKRVLSVNKTLIISVDNLEKLRALKDLIYNFRENGNYKIELLLEGEKKVALPNIYYLSTYDLLDIKNVAGVENVKEI